MHRTEAAFRQPAPMPAPCPRLFSVFVCVCVRMRPLCRARGVIGTAALHGAASLFRWDVRRVTGLRLARSRPNVSGQNLFFSDVPSQTRVANHFAVAPSVHGVPHLHGSMRLVEPHRTI